jgi:sulfur-carrier protein
MGNHTRRAAVGGLRPQHARRGLFRRCRPCADQACAGIFPRNHVKEICVEKQDASTEGVIDLPVTFHIPGALREFTAGHSRVEIEPSPKTLAEALSALWTLYPGVRDRVATEQGQVREHINIFIGDENVRYTGGLASPISAGSEISIVPAVSGG